MQLKKKHIRAFQDAWKQSFGVTISDEVAIREAIPLLELVTIVSKYKISKPGKAANFTEKQLKLIT